ncbi:hypothetical protein AMTR_s00012p00261580 [Amborella trichopoda]|uniref:BTB domain-containing protein n=2 Tax=Amborella trichopoda TaxID=13333 RepID=W1PDM1_AMBTC|nr:hypothetical protein AMTR_s00012p00261580 [Amborella trichopoda]
MNLKNQPDTHSRSIHDTVNGSHDYKIKGYSLAKGMGVGKYLASDTFNVGGYEWAIYFYPDGKNPEDSSLYVSVFIALASEGTDVRALFELTLLDQSGKGKHKVHSHFDRSLASGPYTLKYRGSMWGYKRFFRRSALEASDYLKDDCLAMRCTVGVVRNRFEGIMQYSIYVPPSDMGQCFKELLDTGSASDVVFEVCGETFKAHKLVLATRSPVFKAQFFGLVGDPNIDKIEIEGIEPAVFKAMLHFIYSDTLPDLPESSSTYSWTPMAQHLLAAADRYGLDRLKLVCEARLCEEVSTDSVATTLALAERYHCKQLKDVCLRFAAAPSHLGAVMQSDGFSYLEEECPTILSELLKMVAVADEDSSPMSRKRGTQWLTLSDSGDARRARPRL